MKKLVMFFLAITLIISCINDEEKNIIVQNTEIKNTEFKETEKKVIDKSEKKPEIKEEKLEIKEELVRDYSNFKIEDIFRENARRIILDIDPNIDIAKVNIENFKILDEEILLGDNLELSLNLEKFKRVFKANIGLPSLYEKEKIEVKKRNLDMSKKHIAFTFDDGPFTKYHELIREEFNKYGELATFFVLGLSVNKNPEMLLQTYKDGHEIQNHSYKHPNMRKLSEYKIWQEISKADDEIFKIIGVDTYYFRPPYGAFDDKVINVLGKKSKIALWNVDSEDWKSKNVEIIKSRIIGKVKDGDIVLFHDLYQESYEAIRDIIPILIEEGYQFVTYSEMMELRENKK